MLSSKAPEPTRAMAAGAVVVGTRRPRRSGRIEGGRIAGRKRSAHRIGAVLVWLLVIFNVGALVWAIDTSLRPHKEIFANPWGLPFRPDWSNYVTAWNSAGFGAAGVNSVLLVVTCTAATIAIAAPAAYALSRAGTRWANGLTVYFVLGIGIPVQVIIIPLFSIAQVLHLINNLPGLFLVYVALQLPFTVFLLTGFFRSLPVELEEAAVLDGASALRVFWRVMLPLARPGIVTASMITALGVWNETFVALIFIQSNSNRTLPLALLGFLATQQYNGADYGALFAGLIILTLPMVIVYIWLSRRIIEGMTVGSGK